MSKEKPESIELCDVNGCDDICSTKSSFNLGCFAPGSKQIINLCGDHVEDFEELIEITKSNLADYLRGQ